MKNLQEKNFWISGFFDACGTCFFSKEYPTISILNVDPKASLACLEILKENKIKARLSERSFIEEKKKIKNRKWDVYVEDVENSKKIIDFFNEYSLSKKEQIIWMKNFSKVIDKKIFSDRLKFLNKTNNKVFFSKKELEKKLELPIKDEDISLFNFNNLLIDKNKEKNIFYFCGIVDSKITTISINRNTKKNADKYKPEIKIKSSNKRIIDVCCSTLKENSIGHHILQTKNNNVAKWTITISGINKVIKLSNLIKEHLLVKNEKILFLVSFIKDTIKNNDPFNDIGYNYSKILEDK